MNILVVSGPTREPIDPVRYISNYSTGIMGYSIAEEAHKRKHKVIFITGPAESGIPKCHKAVSVQTAREMYCEILKYFSDVDCLIMASAVCDYRPKKVCSSKISSASKTLNISLVRNPDILKALRKIKKKQFIVGFALQSENMVKLAVSKLKSKGLDIIVANKTVPGCNSPFGFGNTDLTVIFKDGKIVKYDDISKKKFAGILLDNVENIVLGSTDRF